MRLIYNNSYVNDWYFADDDIIKVYRNNAVCYYKVTTSGGTSGQTPCFAVVDDISQYSYTEFEDVFNKADNKWYKLNNLNQYEEYGIYGSGRNISYYDGKLTIDGDYEYKYSGGSWINVGEVSGSTATLPDIPFSVNYNAKNYNAQTQTLLKTSGQLVNVDAVITEGTPTVGDGYLTIASNTRATISGYETYFNRSSSSPNLTIISKQLTDGSNCHMFANRDSNYNWMYRCYSNKLTLHGSSETGQLAVTTQPVIESVRINSSRQYQYNNYTDNTTSSGSSFSYGSANNGKFAMFQGYGTNTGENFVGDFYWVYMSQNTLTDEQVQQVIDYNEGGGQPIYPVEYSEKSDPPNNLSFSSMTEAEEYECPWVGMTATIDGVKYIFSGDSISGYEWVINPSRLPEGYTEVEYVENTGQSTVNLGIQLMATANVTYSIELDNEMSYTSNYGNYQTFLTCCEEVASKYPGWYYRYNIGSTVVIDGSTDTITSTGRTLVSGSTYHTTINGTTPSNMIHNYPLNLFSSLNSAKTPWRFCKGKLYNMTVTYNNNLVRDLVPCINPSNVAGLYDLVNDVFYTSESGYDTLVAGSAV